MSRAAVAAHAPAVHRKAEPAPTRAPPVGAAVPMAAHLGAGERLPAAVSSYFEPRFGADFSAVRVHRDDTGAAEAEAAGAEAFTVGQHIAFGAGRFAPSTASGRQLLGHELAHVVQQRKGGAAPDGRAGSAVEQDASRAGQAAAMGAATIPVRAASGVGVARQEKQEDDWIKRNVGPGEPVSLHILSVQAAGARAPRKRHGRGQPMSGRKREATKYGITEAPEPPACGDGCRGGRAPDRGGRAKTAVDPPIASPPPTQTRPTGSGSRAQERCASDTSSSALALALVGPGWSDAFWKSFSAATASNCRNLAGLPART